MIPSSELMIYTEHENKFYVATKFSVIAVSIVLQGSDRGEISEPFLIYERDINERTWPEYYGEKMKLQLGRYLQSLKLEVIKKEVRDLLNSTELTDEELAVEIYDIEKRMNLEFDTPSEPHDIFPGDPVLEDGVFLLYATDDDLAKFAIGTAEQCIPYMHPWEAYQYLIFLRENALEGA